MIWRNTQDQYGATAKGFHAVVALLILTMLAVGLIMVRMDPSPQMFKIFALHKSVGITVLALATLRLLWRLSNAAPLSLPSHAQWERTLAHIIHALLYVSMFLMPMTGWLGSSAKGYTVSVFGLFTLPTLVEKNRDLAKVMWTIHEYAAYTLIAMIGLHVAGALKHHLIDHDETLWRMVPFIRRRG